MKNSISLRLIVIIIISILLYQCAPTVPKKSMQSPLVKYCNDNTGHIKGNSPWIYGGNCCCAPTSSNYQQHINDGTIDKSITYVMFIKEFDSRGIVHSLSEGHQTCNNKCNKGPHAVQGGSCMSTPIAGTINNENVTSGKKIGE